MSNSKNTHEKGMYIARKMMSEYSSTFKNLANPLDLIVVWKNEEDIMTTKITVGSRETAMNMSHEEFLQAAYKNHFSQNPPDTIVYTAQVFMVSTLPEHTFV